VPLSPSNPPNDAPAQPLPFTGPALGQKSYRAEMCDVPLAPPRYMRRATAQRCMLCGTWSCIIHRPVHLTPVPPSGCLTCIRAVLILLLLLLSLLLIFLLLFIIVLQPRLRHRDGRRLHLARLLQLYLLQQLQHLRQQKKRTQCTRNRLNGGPVGCERAAWTASVQGTRLSGGVTETLCDKP